MQHELILILDFGSQYTQLIARRVREQGVYCEIVPFHHGVEEIINKNQEIRDWAEQYLKNKTRQENGNMSDEEFEKYWKYHKLEIIHAGAAEAMQAFKTREIDN